MLKGDPAGLLTCLLWISCTRSVLALHLERLFDDSRFPTTKPRGRALQEVRKEIVGIHVLLARLLFGALASPRAWVPGLVGGC